MAALDRYFAKRDFGRTPEPSGAGSAPGPALRYAMQKHAATRLHWDLRLEWEGVLLSWAVTRGPSLDPADRRLAVRTEDHPTGYLDFEGVIPAGNYGAGPVMLWDIGHWQPRDPVPRGLTKGHLRFALHGRRMTGGWNLVRMNREGPRENWLLIKEEDEAAHAPDPVARHVTSVATRRAMDAIAAGAAAAPPRRRTGAMPAFRAPQLATASDRTGDPARRWHELKFDGYRALVAIGRGGVRIFTRNGHDWTDRFAPLVPAFEALDCDSALIDGEIVAGAGLYGFGRLQEAIGHGGPFACHAFDLLHLDGRSLVDAPLTDRRRALDALFAGTVPLGLLQTSPVIPGDPAEALSGICAAGGEGLISKRMDAPYRSGRSTAWEKIKCVRREEFVIIGMQPSEARGRPFASLALGTHADGVLRYAGKVGTGFDDATMTRIAALLTPLRRKTPPVALPAAVPDAVARGMIWVTPRAVAEIRYAERTADGLLRHAVFLGLREDKAAAEVTPETPRRAPRPAPGTGEGRGARGTVIAGIRISNGDRVVFPDCGVTKLDVARHYADHADRMLEETAGRPLSLLRLPEGLTGERFFQKHAGPGFPEAIRTVPVPGKGGGSEDHMSVETRAGLVAAAQMGTVEFHIWGARADRPDRPDRMVFDLDPDEGLDIAALRAAAVEIRDHLSGLGLPSWPLLTGGKGVHVVVPLRRVAGWETVTLFARTFATVCAERAPDRYTASISRAARSGRVFIDWLRNDRGATAVAPFSLRARDGAPVAVPIDWAELDAIDRLPLVFLADMGAHGHRSVPRPAPVGLTAATVGRLERWARG